MTADNLTFSIEINYIQDVTEGRAEFEKKMQEVAGVVGAAFARDKAKRPILAGLSASDVTKTLASLGLSAFGQWPLCILTATIATPLPLRAIGMADGWDIYLGEKTFFAFSQFPEGTVDILAKACAYYLDHENYKPLTEFVEAMGFENFRDAVLGAAPTAESAEGYDGNAYASPDTPPLKEGDFVRPEHNVMQVIEVYPEMGPLLMEYGMSCVGCFVSYDENLWQAAQAHGLDVFEIIGEMNEYLSDKYGKPLLSAETPMEDILTLYPQLLTLLQDRGLALPQDLSTPLGKVCEEAGKDLKEILDACGAKLRKEM